MKCPNPSAHFVEEPGLDLSDDLDRVLEARKTALHLGNVTTYSGGVSAPLPTNTILARAQAFERFLLTGEVS